MYEAVPAFVTLAVMPLTFSIPNGILFGTVFHFILYCTTGHCYESMQNIIPRPSIGREGNAFPNAKDILRPTKLCSQVPSQKQPS